MRTLRKFLRRSSLERGLVLRALVVVPLVRVALWVLPFRIVHRFVQRRGMAFALRKKLPFCRPPTRARSDGTPQPRLKPGSIFWSRLRRETGPRSGLEEIATGFSRWNGPIISVGQIAWAVTAVAARVPRATCLTQALAASLLLPRYGHDATLRVGVAKDDQGRLRAHAWLESNGATVLGEPAPGAFHAFPPLVLS